MTRTAGPLDTEFTAVLEKSGADKLPVKAAVRRRIGKEAGASVTVHLLERLD